MADDKNNSKYNGDQNVEEEGEYDIYSIEIIESTNKETQTSQYISLEENEEQISEKAKLAKRPKLSDEDRRKLNNDKARQRRANLSDEDREKINQRKRQRQANLSEEERSLNNDKARQRRANLSEEERSIIRERNAKQHRNKYHADKAFVITHIEKGNQHSKQVADEEIKIDDFEDDTAEEENRVHILNSRRERRNAQSRMYRKARYEQMKDAEEKLQAISNGDARGESDVQQLQLLANKRQQILERGRQYAQTFRQNNHQQHRHWVPIQQLWDEDNPCR
jgi:hypothetical protein